MFWGSLQKLYGYLRVYASVNDELDELVFILINKNDEEESISLEPSNFNLPKVYEMQSYYGNGPYDDAPVLSDWEAYELSNDKITVNLPPVSMSVIRIKSN